MTFIEFKGFDELATRMKAIQALLPVVLTEITASVSEVVKKDAADHVDGFWLDPGSGALRHSIEAYPLLDGPGMVTYGVGSNLVYANIQNYGGQITAKRAPYLVFTDYRTGTVVKKRSVNIKAKRFMQKGMTAGAASAYRIAMPLLEEMMNA